MMRNTLFGMLVMTLVGLAASEAMAWGACHVGYTHVGPNGVYHAGRTVGAGPYGGFSTGHAGFYGSGGSSYHAGYAYGGAHYGGAAYGGAYHYAASPYGGYAAGGFRAGGVAVGGYHAGVYRAW